MTNDRGSVAPRLAAIIVTHGALAVALRDAVQQVTGDARGIDPVTNEGLSGDALVRQLRDIIQAVQAEGCIVFVDSRGSSCANSCLQAVRGLPGVRVISGVNLPMVMDFAARRNDFNLDDMVERLTQRGRDAVQELRSLEP